MWKPSLLAPFLCSAALIAGAAAPAAAPRDAMLVSPDWLAAHLGDPNLVLLHVGEKSEYDARHIPGARYLATRDISQSPQGSDSLTLEMSSPDALRRQLAALGISDDSRVVVYYGKDWVSPSTRAVFTLLYAGLKNVSLLDGGMDAWIKASGGVTDVVPPARTGALSALEIAPIVVDAAFVQAHVRAPGYAVIDARDRAFYDGTQEGGPRDRRKAGHIAGAHSVPFSEVFTEDVKLKSPAQLTDAFTNAGVRPGDTVIAYCHIGQQATAVMFAARTLGHPVVLYDGSFEDWARRDLPVENPSKK
jgi:thiosulfate/3-mercaptopyruvate sulfurtransferase